MKCELCGRECNPRAKLRIQFVVDGKYTPSEKYWACDVCIKEYKEETPVHKW